MKTSLPAPPERLSVPAPPVIISAPAPPEITSSPPLPTRVSIPPLPFRISAPVPPVKESPKLPPCAVSFKSSLLVTVNFSPFDKVVTLASRAEPSTSKAVCVIPAARVIVTLPILSSRPRSVTTSFSTLVIFALKAAVVASPTPSETAVSSFSI